MTTSIASSVCDFSVKKVRRWPYPHVLQDGFIDPDLYQDLKSTFPRGPLTVEPTRFSLYWGDEQYDCLLHENPAWRLLFDGFHSQRFVDYCIAQFGDYWKKAGCRIDLSRARYTPYQEDRVDKRMLQLRKVTLERHELWVRMDIYRGYLGYSQPVHRDLRRRLISMLIYFNDAEETGIEGGNLLLHPSGCFGRLFQPKEVSFSNNRMLMFPCCSRSFHSVNPITAMRQPRQHIQVILSTSIDAWTFG